ncbi:MAG: bifunctional glycosyltransferase/class I SAM-dependent methyltransferase [Deltaproteobacteria bacterium]|nr:bifunctional glycosyltransferase/class I SAM-dependent methyltransferase [Candidatus Deferrimicrobium borealis]
MSEKEITAEEIRYAFEVLDRRRIAIFIVAYNAEKSLYSVIRRIPGDMLSRFAEIFIIDDSSTDRTYDLAKGIKEDFPGLNFNVYRTPFNRGYGGNQKLGYLYCIEKGFDIVILLHGDGQYAPEYLPRVIAGFRENPDAVFASRMVNKKTALQGGMPVYKWAGNQVLTWFENRMLGSSLSEFHTGFRAYKVSSLRNIPFTYNSDDFHFDTEIIVQAVASRWNIQEVPIPAYYGDEKCHVNGLKYAYDCAKSVIKYRLVNLGLYYERNYDFHLFEGENYQFKKSSASLHQYVIHDAGFHPYMVSVELGANRGILSSHIAQKTRDHLAIDIFPPDLAGRSRTMTLDLNTAFAEKIGQEHFDCCIALDVIEHMNDPDDFLREVFRMMKTGGMLFVSTANICYLPVRLSLLLGQFNYGKRGILDRTHKRLFSVRGLRKSLVQHGFKIEAVRGFSPPLTDLVSERWLMRCIEQVHAFLSRLYPKMFAYNFLYVARRQDDLSDIFERTVGREHREASIPSAPVEQRELFPSSENYRGPLAPIRRRR